MFKIFFAFFKNEAHNYSRNQGNANPNHEGIVKSISNFLTLLEDLEDWERGGCDLEAEVLIISSGF